MKYRATHLRRLATVAILLLAICAACSAAQPRNIILIIGDGMGIGAVTSARCAGPGENAQLVLDTMPFTGLVKTHSTKLVTDSAASGTALATGHKTDNGRISTDPQNKRLRSILEAALAMGKSAGVVTTDSVTGATPAVFYAHTDARGKEDDIALQLIASRITVAMGSGKQRFVPKTEGQSGREDGRDLVGEAKGLGFGVAFDASQLAADNSKRLLGLFSFDESGPTLDAMLSKAVSVLAANQKGFFLMAESCLPDKGGHKNDIATDNKGVADLDKALAAALAFAKKDGSTLVVVTSDHETGGLAVLDRNEENPAGKPGWVAGGHTGNMVAVYASGPGAELFTGTHDNTDIPKTFAKLWRVRTPE